MKVKGDDDLLIYRAKCCNPIMGEPIVGYITRGNGVSVHAQSCPNVKNLLYDPERRIAVEWDQAKKTGEPVYDVRLSVEVEDRPGLLAAITAVLAGMNADIRNAEVRTFDDKTAAVLSSKVCTSALRMSAFMPASTAVMAARSPGRSSTSTESRTSYTGSPVFLAWSHSTAIRRSGS